ncbi:MAG TPA: prepilin-type N-terminal cleavage/methylation domain-containing protein [Desulfobacterales bacterium]|nr:prepilin-type N-terminal cleavage/methylation domain-containing protein [Desulfobacterales bacterium]
MKKTMEQTGQDGFTLIEVMFALVILGIGIFAIVAQQTNNMSFNSSSKRQTEGYTWAMDKIERLLVAPYPPPAGGDLTVQGSPNSPPAAPDGHVPNAVDAAMMVPYTLEWDVEACDGANNTPTIPNASKVSVFLRWNARDVANVTFIRTLASF